MIRGAPQSDFIHSYAIEAMLCGNEPTNLECLVRSIQRYCETFKVAEGKRCLIGMAVKQDGSVLSDMVERAFSIPDIKVRKLGWKTFEFDITREHTVRIIPSWLEYQLVWDQICCTEFQFIAIEDYSQLGEEHYKLLTRRLRHNNTSIPPLQLRALSSVDSVFPELFGRYGLTVKSEVFKQNKEVT